MPNKAQLIRDVIETYRKKLLDTSRRNNLMAFKHSERSKNHIRIVNELPDEIYNCLSNGKALTFNALPETDFYLPDENNDFKNKFEQAKLFDGDYLKAISNATSAAKSKSIEYEFRNKIREEFGLPLRDDYTISNNAEIAQLHGIDPSFDLPLLHENRTGIPDNKITYVQTLLLPAEMNRKLSGIYSIVNNDITESGVNTLFAAFGFLRWYESESSEPCDAPLMLLRLEMEKKQTKGGYSYSIKSTGDEPEINLSLFERLQHDFGLMLPEINDNDTPESYMKKISNTINKASGLPQKKKWSIKRFVTVGRFHFARLMMYNDLDIEKWGDKIIGNNIIEKLLYGTNEEVDLLAEDYLVDKPEIEKLVPLLITDADASQHSAIVDAMKDKNLVIKGPPGTGKSQTITNIIANALHSGKKILFLAEKMAALNVVYDRLRKANLDRYCIELHSNKAKRLEIAKAIKERLYPLTIQKDDVATIAHEFDTKRKYLSTYVDTLNQPFGKQNKSIHDYLWAMQYSKKYFDNMGYAIKQLNISFAQANMDISQYNRGKEFLSSLIELKKESSFDGVHPWHFISNYALNPFEQAELVNTVREWLMAVKQLQEELDNHKTNHWDPNSLLTFEAVEGYIDVCQQLLRTNINRLNSELIESINDRQKTELFVKYVDDYTSYEKAINSINSIDNPQKHFDQMETIEKCIYWANTLELWHLNAREIKSKKDKLNDKIANFNHTKEQLSTLIDYFKPDDNCLVGYLADIIELHSHINDISTEIWNYRNVKMAGSNGIAILQDAFQKQLKTSALLADLQNKLNLSLFNIEEVRQDIRTLAGGGILSSLFDKSYKQAKEIYKAACINGHKFSKSESLINLGNYVTIHENIEYFNKDTELINICGEYFKGDKTNFEMLYKIVQLFASLNSMKFRKDIHNWLISTPPDILESFQQLDVLPIANILKLFKSSWTVKDLQENLNESIESALDKEKKTEILHEILENLGCSCFEDVEKDYENLQEAALLFKEMEGNTLKDIVDPRKFKKDEETIAFFRHCLRFNEKHWLYASGLSFAEKWQIFNQTIIKLKDLYAKATDTNITDFNRCFDTMEWEVQDLSDLINDFEYALNYSGSLANWVQFNDYLNNFDISFCVKLANIFIKEKIDFSSLVEAYDSIIVRAMAKEIYQQYPKLNNYKGINLNNAQKLLKQRDHGLRISQCKGLCARLEQNKPLWGISAGSKKTWTEGALLRNEAEKQRRHISIRDLMLRAGESIQNIKPCFLMSPLSVAQYLPHDLEFDLLIIDEASQMRPEDALGAMIRAKNIIVVGDQKQLPPTSFFQKTYDEEEEDEDYDIEESIMDMAVKRFYPARLLSRHYRSRHESLIAYSNRYFYDDNLVLFPSPNEDPQVLGIRSKYVGGIYKSSINNEEANEIVKEALAMMRTYPKDSLGIVAMNQKQEEFIGMEMDKAFVDHSYAAKYRDSWQSTLYPFFVKNLESVQGDERDTIIISTVYGPRTKGGKPEQRFGPINQSGGHRRLNVLFSRAKKRTIVVTSLKPEDIVLSNGASEGLKAFKGFLTYAEKRKLDSGSEERNEPENDFERWVKESLEGIGCEVFPQVGVAGYRIDLGIKHPDYAYGYLLGVECDGATYHSAKSARERDIIRQQVLEGLGWNIYRIWSTDWFADPSGELEKLKKYINSLLSHDQNKIEIANLEKNADSGDEIDQVFDESEFNKPNVKFEQKPQFKKAQVMAKHKYELEDPRVRFKQQPEPEVICVKLYDIVEYSEINGIAKTIYTRRIAPKGDGGQTISADTPLALALLGASEGEEVEANLPDRQAVFKIERITREE